MKYQITSRKTMTTFRTKYASKNMQYNSRKVSKTKVCNIFHVRGGRKVSTKFAFLFWISFCFPKIRTPKWNSALLFPPLPRTHNDLKELIHCSGKVSKRSEQLDNSKKSVSRQSCIFFVRRPIMSREAINSTRWGHMAWYEHYRACLAFKTDNCSTSISPWFHFGYCNKNNTMVSDFYRTRVRSLASLVIHSLTHSLTALWLMWPWHVNIPTPNCWGCYCCWCWCWEICWR